MDGSHCQIVANALAADGAVDERAFASVAILAERLDLLKEQSSLFAGIEFSPYVDRLRQRAEPISIG